MKFNTRPARIVGLETRPLKVRNSWGLNSHVLVQEKVPTINVTYAYVIFMCCQLYGNVTTELKFLKFMLKRLCWSEQSWHGN